MDLKKKKAMAIVVIRVMLYFHRLQATSQNSFNFLQPSSFSTPRKRKFPQHFSHFHSVKTVIIYKENQNSRSCLFTVRFTVFKGSQTDSTVSYLPLFFALRKMQSSHPKHGNLLELYRSNFLNTKFREISFQDKTKTK